MSSDRTKRRHMRKAEFVSVGPVWLTEEQAERVKAEDAANRAKALGKERKDD